MFNIRNSIIADNAVSDPQYASSRNCDVSADVSAVYAGRNIADDDTCDPAVSVAPALDLPPLASNGGPTMTHALVSPKAAAAIDAGISCSEATDQRYVSRPQGATCDVGAFEFNDFVTYTITIGPNVAVNAKTGVVTLTGTVACSKPTIVPTLDVEMTQTQKSPGRFTTIVKGTSPIDGIACATTPSSWSVAFGPQSGKFEPGAATGTGTITAIGSAFLSATVTSPLKVFQVK